MYRDTVPVFVDHHHAKEHAEREKEEAVDIVLDRVAYIDGKREQNDLCNREECGAEDDVANRPSVFQRTEDENELRDDIDDGTNQGP